MVFVFIIRLCANQQAVSQGESTVGGRSSGGRGESYADGVKGLKALGVKAMTYKMLFIACSVINIKRTQ